MALPRLTACSPERTMSTNDFIPSEFVPSSRPIDNLPLLVRYGVLSISKEYAVQCRLRLLQRARSPEANPVVGPLPTGSGVWLNVTPK